jgi:hypothetical protein
LRLKIQGGGRRVEVGGWRLEGGGWRVESGGFGDEDLLARKPSPTPGMTTNIEPTASEQRGENMKRLKKYCMKTKARIWP